MSLLRSVKAVRARALLGLLRDLVRCKTSEQCDDLLRIWAFENWVRLPVIYTDQYGLRYVLHPGQNAQVYFQNKGNYEVAETRFCANFVQPGMITFDVGSNIGLYALLFARLVGSAGQVHAFEPERQNYQRLLTNIALNGFNNIKSNQSAVFSSSRVLRLNVFPDSVNAWHTLGYLTLPDPYHPGQMLTPPKSQDVPGISLDDYCASSGITHIDLLKVDVEGAELDVLRGARKLLQAGQVTAVMFEVSLPQVKAMGHEPDEIFALLHGYGLRLFSLSGEGQLLPTEEVNLIRYQNLVALRDGV